MPHFYMISGKVAITVKDSDQQVMEEFNTIFGVKEATPKFSQKALLALHNMLGERFKEFVLSNNPELAEDIGKVEGMVQSISYLGEMTEDEFKDLDNKVE